jgi:hypothetical protein
MSNNIELHRNPTDLKNGCFSENTYYFLLFSFFRRVLHTVKGRAFGSPFLCQRRGPNMSPLMA